MIQLHLTDDVAQGGGGKALDGCDGLVDTVGVELGIHDLEEHHGIDLHGYVIAGDHRGGKSATCSFRLTFLAIRSMNGILTCRPADQVSE